MAPKRPQISVRGVTYGRIATWCQERGISHDELVRAALKKAEAAMKVAILLLTVLVIGCGDNLPPPPPDSSGLPYCEDLGCSEALCHADGVCRCMDQACLQR